MKCPVCGEQTKGIDHNGRGLRCTACWELLPEPEPAPEVVVVPEKPKAPPAKKIVRRTQAKRGGTS